MSSSSSNQVFYQLPVQALLAITGYGEAATEGSNGLLAVMNVIKNRTKSPGQFADPSVLSSTQSVYHATILKPYQFSVFNSGDPGRSRMENFASDFESYYQKDSVLRTAYDLAGKVLSGALTDNTKNATFYHASYTLPSWASEIPLIGQIGTHIFYGYSELAEQASKIVTNPANLIWIAASGMLLLILLKRNKR